MARRCINPAGPGTGFKHSTRLGPAASAWLCRKAARSGYCEAKVLRELVELAMTIEESGAGRWKAGLASLDQGDAR